jgi:hypothetical protein
VQAAANACAGAKSQAAGDAHQPWHPILLIFIFLLTPDKKLRNLE